MAVILFCDDSQNLLRQIKAAIANGKVETWLVDTDGDLTHSPAQWRNQAWFRPSLQQDRLVLNLLGNRNKRMSKEIYGVYHGRFIEMILVHFDLNFTRAIATALPILGDWVGPRSEESPSRTTP